MLLDDEQKTALAARIIDKAKALLDVWGKRVEDRDTGFVHEECRLPPFLLIEHQRQTIRSGSVKTNGLDIWSIEGDNAKKTLSVHYVPFEILHFDHAGKAGWIELFLDLPEGGDRS